jgi:hypothetical protein
MELANNTTTGTIWRTAMPQAASDMTDSLLYRLHEIKAGG